MFSSKQRGFTLIELVVVIVILGILAAFAVPKFMGLETQARVASLNALAGSIRSSAAMARGVWMASGSPATITVDGQVVTITNGYPNRASIPNTLQDTSGFTWNAGNGRYTPNGARVPGGCYIQYNQAPANGSYSIVFPGNTTSQATAQATLRANC